MVLVERSGETIRNGKRSRGPSPNGRGTPETSSDDDSTKKVSGRSTKSKEYDEKIRVGRDYQAVCPEFIPPTDRKGELNERALLVWAPTKDIADDRLDEYIEVAKDKFGYNGEQALGMLFWHKHDLERAVLDLANFTPFPDEWSVEDRVLFEQAFQFHGKSFHRIRQMLPDKSIASLVKYYYSWKKSRAHTSAMDRPEKEHSNGSNADDESEEDDSRKWPLHRGIRRASGSSPSRGFIDDHTVHPTNQANAGQVANGINVVQTEVGTTGMATTSTANNQNQNPNGTSATTNQNHNEISMAGVPLLNCTGCGVNCHKINVFPLGKLCNSCNHHWRRTGVLRPTSGPSYLGGTKRRTGGNNANISAGGNGGSGTTFNTNVSGKHKRKPPRGMYINHDDIVELAGSDINETKSIELLASMDREVISLLTQIQQNKQNISTLKRKLARNIPELRPYDNSNRINSRWSNEELLIAVEGVKEYGKNFEAIAEAIGTKTEAQVRTFFVNYRRRYNLDNMLKEYEMKHSQRQRAPLNGGNRSNDGSSGDEENLQIVIDEDASSGNDRPNNREHNITVTSTTGIIHGQANSTNNSTAIVIDGIDGDDDVIITKESPPPGINGNPIATEEPKIN